MGRTKYISDEELICLIDRFFTEKCNRNIKALKIKALGDFIRNEGYPDVQDYLIRRNPIAREHIEELKCSSDAFMRQRIVVFKNIDAEAFVEKNSSKADLVNALNVLDSYYQNIVNSANYCINKYNDLEDENIKLKKKIENLQNAIYEKQNDFDAIMVDIKKQKMEINKLQQTISCLKGVVNQYVYPEIANILLAQDGNRFVNGSSEYIDEHSVDKTLISANTSIPDALNSNIDTKDKNKVIEGLFNKIDNLEE